MADMQTILEEVVRFEQAIRDAFDAGQGKSFPPLCVMHVMVNPGQQERFDEPTPMPVIFNQPAPPDIMLKALQKSAVLSEAVMSFIAYPTKDGIKMRAETEVISHEWLIPVVAQDGGPPYLGKRLEYGHGEGPTAKVIDDLDVFGGILPKQGELVISMRRGQA